MGKIQIYKIYLEQHLFEREIYISLAFSFFLKMKINVLIIFNLVTAWA